MVAILLFFAFLPPSGMEKTTIFFQEDPSIRYSITGNSGNVILSAHLSEEAGSGLIQTDYQKGNGFVAFDKNTQHVTADFKKKFSFNHLAKAIRKDAPKMKIFAPHESTVDLNLKLIDLGIGQFNFANLNVSHLDLDARFGEVYLDFPTENKVIIRDQVHIHLMAGKLEITDLANLKAEKWWINGGVGDLSLDIGEKLLKKTEIRLDLDIGELTINIPKGTKVEIRGTSRKMDEYGFLSVGKEWIAAEYHQSSPLLTIHLLGPLGSLNINWK